MDAIVKAPMGETERAKIGENKRRAAAYKENDAGKVVRVRAAEQERRKGARRQRRARDKAR